MTAHLPDKLIKLLNILEHRIYAEPMSVIYAPRAITYDEFALMLEHHRREL